MSGASLANRQPLLSIVIPTFNRRDYVAYAIASALSQTWPRIEVIVVDDGSRDGTEGLLLELAERHPEHRFRYAIQENQGPSTARNRGLTMAQGDFVKFLDSDDTLDFDAAEAYLNAMEKTGADLCIGSRRYMSPAGEKWRLNYVPPQGVIPESLTAFFDLRLKPQGALWCYRKTVFDHISWDETLLAREDTDLLARILIGGAVVCGAPGACYNQRYHQLGRQIEKQYEPAVLEAILASNERQLALMQEHDVGGRVRRAFARSMSRTALRLWTRDRTSALRLYRLARKGYPFPELVAIESYPMARHLRFAAYWLWLLGGVRLCGPLWALYCRRRG